MLLIRNYYKKFFTSVTKRSNKASKHAFHWRDGAVFIAKGVDLLNPKLKADDLTDVGIWEDVAIELQRILQNLNLGGIWHDRDQVKIEA